MNSIPFSKKEERDHVHTGRGYLFDEDGFYFICSICEEKIYSVYPYVDLAPPAMEASGGVGGQGGVQSPVGSRSRLFQSRPRNKKSLKASRT